MYVIIARKFIDKLRESWTSFCRSVRDAIDQTAKKQKSDVINEARDDIYNDRYSAESVNDWEDEQLELIESWRRDNINFIDRSEREGKTLINRFAEKKFDQDDYAAQRRFVLDFCKLSFTHEWSEKGMNIEIKGVTMSGTCGNYSYEKEFDPPALSKKEDLQVFE